MWGRRWFDHLSRSFCVFFFGYSPLSTTCLLLTSQHFCRAFFSLPSIPSPTEGGNSIFNHHGGLRPGVQERRGGEAQRGLEICVCAVLTLQNHDYGPSKQLRESLRKLCVYVRPPTVNLTFKLHISIKPEYPTASIRFIISPLLLDCASSAWTEADFQREKRVIEQDCHRNLCP